MSRIALVGSTIALAAGLAASGAAAATATSSAATKCKFRPGTLIVVKKPGERCALLRKSGKLITLRAR